MLRSSIVLVAFLISLGTNAQRYLFENISVNEGLPGSNVNCMLQDQAGIIWLGTEAGLASYDGRINTYSERDGMAPNGVKSIAIAENGDIWVGHLSGGLSRLTRRQALAFTLPDSINVDITGIRCDGDKIIISTQGDGLWSLTGPKEDGTFAQEKRIGDLDAIFALSEMDDKTAVITSRQVFTLNDDLTLNAENLPIPPGLGYSCVFQDSEDHIWVGTMTSGAFKIVEGKSTHFNKSNGLPDNTIMSFAEGENGEIWIGTWNKGIARIQETGIRRYSIANGLHGNTVRTLLFDREGVLLVGTRDNGLDLYKGERFLHFGSNDNLINPHVWAGMEDRDGNLWFGTNGGITMLRPNGKTISFSSEREDLSSDKVRCMVQTENGRIWLGTESGGLLEFLPSSFGFSSNVPFQTQIPQASVTSLIEGRPNELWVGTFNGMFRYDTETGLFDYFDRSNGISGRAIKTIYKDSDGSLWIGTRAGGINVYRNGVFSTVDLGMVTTPTAFLRDANKRMWVGTEGNGMLVLNNDEKELDYSEEDGLMSSNIRSLALDGFGNVWVGTNKGANEWRASEGRFIKYSKQSGFVGLEAKPGAVWRSGKGDLWFGTSDGAVKVGAQANVNVEKGPLIVIHGLIVNGELAEENQTEFSHTDRDFTFEYGAVSLRDPSAVRYQIKVNGLNESWVDVENRTRISYPLIPAGSYEFHARAMDRSGIWSEPSSFQFTVNPPFWQTWWFMFIAGLLLALGVVGYNRYRSRLLKMRNQVLEKRVKERTAEVVKQGEVIAKQKNRVEELLLNILPKEISEELSESGEARARSHDAVTVMFTDMKGFTQVAEQMSPEALVNELHRHFGRFDDVTGKLGLEKIKTIGDSYMAACGIPHADEHHAIKTVLAALEIRELMRDWQEEKRKAGEIHWSLRIGIHSGPIVAGVVGKKKFAYDIWGDTVNTASRMESSGEPDTLNVSKETWKLVQDYVEWEHRGKIKAKNKGEVDMYFIHRLKPEYSLTELGLRPNDTLKGMLGLLKPHTADLA